MPVFTEWIYAIAALACAGLAAVFDIRERRIPNRLTVPAFVLGLLLHLALDGGRGLGAAAGAALMAGGIFMVFHIAGGMGAGDVKLMAALGCLSATRDVRSLVIATMVVGAVFALCLALWRGALRVTVRNMFVLVAHHREYGIAAHPELNVSNDATLRLPYAVPMAVASALVLLMHLVPGGAQ